MDRRQYFPDTGIAMFPSGDPRYAREIQRSPNGSTGWVSIAVLPPDGGSFIDTQPIDGVARYYQARSVELLNGAILRTSPFIPCFPTNGKPIQLSTESAPSIQAAKFATQPSTDTSSRYRCHAYNSAAQSVPDSTATLASFDAEIFDFGGLHSPSVNPSRLTIPALNIGGTWGFVGAIQFVANATGYRSAQLLKNGAGIGARVTRSVVSVANKEEMMIPWVETSLAAGDYFEIELTQTSGGNLNVFSRLIATHLW